jgi:hypothetical protein
MSLKATLLNVWYCANLVPRVIVHPALKALRDYRLNVRRSSSSVLDLQLSDVIRVNRC